MAGCLAVQSRLFLYHLVSKRWNGRGLKKIKNKNDRGRNKVDVELSWTGLVPRGACQVRPE